MVEELAAARFSRSTAIRKMAATPGARWPNRRPTGEREPIGPAFIDQLLGVVESEPVVLGDGNGLVLKRSVAEIERDGVGGLTEIELANTGKLEVDRPLVIRPAAAIHPVGHARLDLGRRRDDTFPVSCQPVELIDEHIIVGGRSLEELTPGRTVTWLNLEAEEIEGIRGPGDPVKAGTCPETVRMVSLPALTR